VERRKSFCELELCRTEWAVVLYVTTSGPITLPNPSRRVRGYDVLPRPTAGEGWGEGNLQIKAIVNIQPGEKMKRIIIIVISALLIPVISNGKDASKQLSVDTIQVLKIAAQDERAVIRTPNGKTQIIKPGDTLAANSKVTEIAVDRVVVEEKKENETEKVIIRLVNGKQKVERMKKAGEQTPAMYAPVKKDEKDKTQGNSVR